MGKLVFVTPGPPPPRLYADLAPWFHLLTAPADYADEAARYVALLREALGAGAPLGAVLELGSGGGNLASRYEREVGRATLVDLSPGMLTLSETINPDCEHVQGDMRTVRLGRVFDAVIVHDAVCYMTTGSDLQAALRTAFEHCRPGGAAIFIPDFVRETFAPGTDHGGHDDPASGRGLRYLEWTTDPDPTDSTYDTDFVYLLREPGRPLQVIHDHHEAGLFARADWLAWLRDAGFEARAVRPDPGADPACGGELFLCRRPG